MQGSRGRDGGQHGCPPRAPATQAADARRQMRRQAGAPTDRQWCQQAGRAASPAGQPAPSRRPARTLPTGAGAGARWRARAPPAAAAREPGTKRRCAGRGRVQGGGGGGSMVRESAAAGAPKRRLGCALAGGLMRVGLGRHCVQPGAPGQQQQQQQQPNYQRRRQQRRRRRQQQWRRRRRRQRRTPPTCAWCPQTCWRASAPASPAAPAARCAGLRRTSKERSDAMPGLPRQGE